MQPSPPEKPCATAGDIERLRADLDALRQAAGLELPFGREDVRANLAVAAGGAVALIWASLPIDLPGQWGAVPLILVVVGYVAWMRVKYRQRSGRSPVRRREYTSGIVGMFVVGALALAYRFWAGELGVSTTIAGSALLFVFGVAMLVPVLRDRNRTPDLGVAVPLIACGLFLPASPVSLWVVIGAVFLISGLVTAALMAHSLQDAGAGHASD